jgi:hypothetical protein
MATELRIRWVRIRTGEGWQEPYDLDAPVVAVVGEVDTGKGSLLDCIAYALGREIDMFRGAVEHHLREVEIGVRLQQGTVVMRRARSSGGHVDVLDEVGTSVGRFPTKAKDARASISEWILEQLGLVDTFASVRLTHSQLLDFASALLPYCYLTQNDIDRYIVRSARDDKERLIVLKLLLNLTTAEYERLAGEIHENELEINRLSQRANVVTEFLAESQATDRNAVAEEIERLRAARDSAEHRLSEPTSAARRASQLGDAMRNRVILAHRAVGDAEIALDATRLKHARAQSRVEEIEDALLALDKLESQPSDDRATLRLAINQCPVCEADLSERPYQPGSCELCLSPLPGQKQLLQRHQLNAAHQDALGALEGLKGAVKETANLAQIARDELKRLSDSIDAQAGDSVTPYVDAIKAASAELAGISAQLEALTRLQDAHDRLAERYANIAELRARQIERQERLTLRGADVEKPEDVIGSLSRIFRGIVQAIQLPNATGRARVDLDTLLPWVDEQSFAQRGGGARSAVSIAYSLALLTYTLENDIATLPSLLVIDSPQKNFGANRNDKLLAHRIYERFLDLMQERQAWDHAGRFARPYQLVIVDNDIHADIAKRIKVHRFTREQGFIRNLKNPHGPAIDGDQMELDDLEEG